jgi:hypothetical protein
MQSRATGTAIGVVVALTTAGLLIAIALLPRAKPETPPAPRTQNRTLSVVEEAARNKLSEDVDNDGLQDWEETLWNTKTDNPDSDNDGTTDGDEVKAGRNPARKGPNDTVAPKTQIAAASAATGTELTQTDRLGRELFVEYMAKKQAGEMLTENDIAGMIAPLVASYTGQPQTPKYTVADIKIGADSKNNIRRYGNEFGVIDREQAAQEPEHKGEFDILAKFATNPEGEKLDDLRPTIARTRTLVTKVSALEVPQNFVVVHIDFLNHLSGYADSLETVTDFERDPLASLVALKSMEGLNRAIYTDLQKIARRFKDSGVTFAENETGYVFAALATLPEIPTQAAIK